MGEMAWLKPWEKKNLECFAPKHLIKKKKKKV